MDVVYSASGGVKPSSGPSRFRNGRKSDSSMPYQIPNRADIASGWSHDLFEEGSSVYNPRLASHSSAAAPLLSPPGLNPSARPFGSYTPDLPGVAPTPTGPKSQRQPAPLRSASAPSLAARLGASAPPAAKSGSLLARMGLVDQAPASTTGTASKKNKRTGGMIKGAAEVARIAAAAPPPPPPPPVVPAPPRGTTVLVSNLVAGTTAEDVQAAFSDFGNITQCLVDQMPNSLLYAAKVVFKLQSEAEQARATLEYARGLHSGESMFTNEHSGVLADGERLKVVIVPDQPRQPITTSAVPTGPASMRVARSNGTPSDLAMRLGLPGNNAIPPAATNSSRAIRPATLMPLARSIPDEPSKMRSDEVMRFDPRASIITQPAGVEEEEQRRGRGGRKSWRGAKGRRSAGGMDLD